ncbi:MAG: tRNA preQ1(34) S-adenosylmethionine ribosyltransferase-isomerase QueA [Planctomycetales bacterium]|nr:tRNA preQ1(34) S-adenosylmethionine ribosyltransferase-isomerase QueA [Planctomycetales bacterium]
MTHISEYDFDLPKDLIAQQPKANRPDSRLMVIERATGQISHRHVRDLPEILSPDDCLVMNDSKVVPARLVGHRANTGGKFEGLFLRTEQHGIWQILCKTRGKIQPGERVSIQAPGQSTDAEPLSLQMLAKLDGGMWAVKPEVELPVFDLLQKFGRIPLPHYIRDGEMTAADVQSYQTVYAKDPGSVAAPTAGLHFNQHLLDQIQRKGCGIQFVTLHVGIGTFRPIAVDHLDQHQMHAEWGSLSAETADCLRRVRTNGRLVAVGTTSVRVLESAARSGKLESWTGETELFIQPGFAFHAVDSLMTNFHLPKSSLLVLVRTFGGDELMREAYDIAIREEYRFFSYGDAMLIL